MARKLVRRRQRPTRPAPSPAPEPQSPTEPVEPHPAPVASTPPAPAVRSVDRPARERGTSPPPPGGSSAEVLYPVFGTEGSREAGQIRRHVPRRRELIRADYLDATRGPR
jgi:hypothetical protein